ncbi:uncharacterized protein RCC_01754 [Lecanosticta acicola]|uniref:Uncharacterized protein RCC_01754 n=1 Tax=Lecanosticta acicola TaxID=111012 RepID=A0AAI8YUT6_9PEZI|nr:uncharacterized protein RCC_01754 [Lecanosticta acicola]
MALAPNSPSKPTTSPTSKPKQLEVTIKPVNSSSSSSSAATPAKKQILASEIRAPPPPPPTESYYIAWTARSKLSYEARQRDHKLRMLVGHANLLDKLVVEIADEKGKPVREK